jgi:hypothetical protein
MTPRVRGDSSEPVVFSIPVGSGTLVISGILDAWQFRDPATTGFASFWTRTIAALSVSNPRRIVVMMDRRTARSGEQVRIDVRANVGAAISGAYIVGAADSTFVRLWPASDPGRYYGRFIAPRTSGSYRLTVREGSDHSSRTIAVDSGALVPTASEAGQLAAFADSRGGRAIPEDSLDHLPSLVATALRPVPRKETWHPMRSPWWIVPFALALGAEWWWRRRRGLP